MAQTLARLVRDVDRDRYRSVLYAPEGKRDALFALYAFNAEIASIRDRVSEPMSGEIRLQWWRDVIASGNPQAGAGHPVAQALVETIIRHRLHVNTFDSYLEARIFDLYNDPMSSRTDLEVYCNDTAAALIHLAAIILDGEAALKHIELAGHAGRAQAISGLLLLLPIHRSRGQCYIPRDILTEAGITPEEFIVSANDQRSIVASQVMVALAREHLVAFECHAKTLPYTLRPAFLPLALTSAYLDHVELSKDCMSSIRKHFLMFRTAFR